MCRIEYNLILSKRKNAIITIVDGEVVVKAPTGIPRTKIDEFVQSNKDWVATNMDKYYARYHSVRDIMEFEKIIIQGKRYKIGFSLNNKRVHLSGDSLLLPQNLKQNPDKIKMTIKNWYKKFAVDFLLNRIEQYSKSLNFSYNGISLTNAKGKWGSCDTAGHIKLNWRLVMLESYLCDYVIVHELCHTVHHNHSSDYWSLVKTIIPQYKLIKEKLKNYSLFTEIYR